MKNFSFLLMAIFLASCSTKKTVDSNKVAGDLKAAELKEQIKLSQQEAEQKAKEETPKLLPWNYTELGPSEWSKLSEDYVLCEKGLEQSPVNLKWSKPLVARNLEFFYQPGVFQVEAHKQKLQVTFEKGNYATVDGQKWNLVALQVHTPGEHVFTRKKFPLELHLIHYNEEQTKLGMIAVMFKLGKPSVGVATLLKHLPKKVPAKVFVESEPLNPSLFLPLVTTHYAYQGSLTTPPCTEGVAWTVLNTPVEVSVDQLVELQKVLKDNARPVQPLNHRKPVNYN